MNDEHLHALLHEQPEDTQFARPRRQGLQLMQSRLSTLVRLSTCGFVHQHTRTYRCEQKSVFDEEHVWLRRGICASGYTFLCALSQHHAIQAY
eukprot:739737-Pleurochrysis_carterae.AAC.1